VTRWLAGVFDRSGRIDVSRLTGALAPHAASIIDSAPLRVAYSGPVVHSTNLLCLFDGHLDNPSEIRRELESAVESPEELLAAGYRRWGRELLPRLRGDFVLLIWDRERAEGLLARDQLGVRPFFLHDAGGGELYFASEIRHLLALLPRRPAPDPTSVAHWIAVSNRPGMSTLYSGIRRLSPGGVLLLSRHGLREESYWAPRFEEPLDVPDAQLAVTMREALQQAVHRRVDAEGLTGVLMSGGLDSSSIAALCTEHAGDRVYACSATFPEHPAADESELIDQLRQTLAIPGLTAEVRPGGLLASALESLAAWQVPLRSWGDFWALPLMRAAAETGIGTILGGDGGDELFEARAYLLADRLRAGRPRDALALALALPGAGERPARREVARVFGSLALVGALPYRLHDSLQRPFATRGTPAWLRPWVARGLVGSDDPLAWKRLDGPRWWANAAHGITRRIEEGGVFEHHRRRAALAGVESRHPLLDLDLVALGLRQPPRATFDRHLSRPILRASMEGLLPDAVRIRPAKALFESLIADCLRGPDLEAVRGLLLDPGAELGAYVELDGVRRALLDTDLEFRSSPFRWMWQVWRLVNAECWLRAQAHPIGELPLPTLRSSPPRIAIRPTAPSYVFPP
jgi:asparagine synthase (glutamine-hydrolysing)